MPLFFNGTEVKKVFYNGTEVKKINYNGTEISFGKIQPRWVGQLIIPSYNGETFAKLMPHPDDNTYLFLTGNGTTNQCAAVADAWRFNVQTQQIETLHGYNPNVMGVCVVADKNEGLMLWQTGSNTFRPANNYNENDSDVCSQPHDLGSVTGAITIAEDGSLSGTARHDASATAYVEIKGLGDTLSVNMSGKMSSGDLHLEW